MRIAIISSLCLLVLSPLHADTIPEAARTKANSLNDLVRELPFTTGSWMDQLSRRSAIQEQLQLHERKMRGEGLPIELANNFSINYSDILSALVDDRLDEQSGRELLAEHRRQLAIAHEWMTKSERLRNENFLYEMTKEQVRLHDELRSRSLLSGEVPDNLRTPMVNGYQAWVGELIAWGESSGGLRGADLARLRTKLTQLERFETIYKADGILQPGERKKLHGHLTSQALDIVLAVSR